MKKISVFILSLCCISLIYGQEKNFIDRPYIETTTKVDTLVVPDRIYLSIYLSESSTKESIEEQETKLRRMLRELNINTQTDLTILSYGSRSSLKINSTSNKKRFSLLVYNKITAEKVLKELYKLDIKESKILKTEYSKVEKLNLELKAKAIIASQKTASRIAGSINQKIGKAIYINDIAQSNSQEERESTIIVHKNKTSDINKTTKAFSINLEKLKFEAELSVKYSLE